MQTLATFSARLGTAFNTLWRSLHKKCNSNVYYFTLFISFEVPIQQRNLSKQKDVSLRTRGKDIHISLFFQISLSQNRPAINYLLFHSSFFTSHKGSSSSHSTSNTFLLLMVSADSGVPMGQESGNDLRHRHRSIDVQVWKRH